jgi:hypothetical protein
MSRSFKQIKSSNDTTSSAEKVFHSGPSGVYTFSKRDGIDTYQTYNPSPEAQGNRVPFGSGSIGTPPLALMSGGKVMVFGHLDPGKGAGFSSAFSSNVGEIPDLENYPESGIWKNSNAEAGVETTGGDTDSDTGTGGESCSSDTADGITVTLTGRKANSDTDETWDASASKEFLNSELPLDVTGVIKLGGEVFGVAQPFNNPTFEFESFPNVSSPAPNADPTEGDFTFTGIYSGFAIEGIPTLTITYKDGCNTCYKENKDDSDALIGCWPQVPEMSKIFSLFKSKPFDKIVRITGGGSSKKYQLSPASADAGKVSPEISFRPEALSNSDLDFEVIGHDGGVGTMGLTVVKIGELVEFKDDGTQVNIGQGNGTVLLSMVESEWSHASLASATIKSREVDANGYIVDPTTSNGFNGLENYIKYEFVNLAVKDTAAVGQVYSATITFNPSPVGGKFPKWRYSFAMEVI